jgi:hypothetical protein
MAPFLHMIPILLGQPIFYGSFAIANNFLKLFRPGGPCMKNYVVILLLACLLCYSVAPPALAEVESYRAPRRGISPPRTQKAPTNNVTRNEPRSPTRTPATAPGTNRGGFFGGGGLLRGIFIGGMAGLLFGSLFANMGAMGNFLGLLINLLSIYIIFLIVRSIVRYFINKRNAHH